METLLSLAELGSRLAQVDNTLMLLIKNRMELVDQVGRIKRKTGDAIFRPDVEDRRIAKARSLARTYGVNEHFAESLQYLLIQEACKRQMIQLQAVTDGTEPSTEEEWYEVLKSNLRILTRRTAPSYDVEYGQSYFATRSYLELENDLLAWQVSRLPHHELLVDIGCATGRVTFSLSQQFLRSVGFDISPDMIEVAKRSAGDRGVQSHCVFREIDIEAGIPVENNSASFVVMNFGTASEIREFGKLFREILRILKPGGRFFLSFYNTEALVYKWELLPWPAGLSAVVNLRNQCLDVQSENEILSVYARSYRVAEVRGVLAQAGVGGAVIETFPTISSVLPTDLFEGQPDLQRSITAIDRELMSDTMGAYIIARGEKK